MRYYPIFVKLSGKHCLVVGAGQVGRRKIATLAEAGAELVTVVDPAEPDAEFKELLARDNIEFKQRGFEDQDLDGAFLVIACTDSEELNWRISKLCAEKNIPCNIVDQPEKCSFIVPAMFTQGDLTLAVSTGGSSPALAKKIRKDLKDHFGAEYALMLLLMDRLRPLVLGLNRPTSENTAIFRKIVDSNLLSALAGQDQDAARAILRDCLPGPLHPQVPELIDGLV